MPKAGNVYLQIYDLQGKALHQKLLGFKNAGEDWHDILLSEELASGQLLIVKLRDDSGNIHSTRILRK